MDQITKELCLELELRAAKGLLKYGVSVADRKDLSAAQWLQHGLEEVLDLAVYLKKLRAEIERLQRREEALLRELEETKRSR